MSTTEGEGPFEGGEPAIVAGGAGEGPSAGPGAASASAAAVPAAIRPGRVWGLALAAGLLAGVAGWLGGEAIYGRFIPPLMATGGVPSVEELQEAARVRNAAVTREASSTAAMLGAALGLALGAAGGLARGSGRSAAIAGLAGAALGGLGGAAATWGLMPVYFRWYNPDKDDLMVALLIQGGIAAAIGAGAGAAFGDGVAGGPRGEGRGVVGRALVGGLIGAAAGVVLFQIVGVLAFPLDQTSKPVSTSWGSRLFSHMAIAVLGAAGSAWGALQPARPGRARS